MGRGISKMSLVLLLMALITPSLAAPQFGLNLLDMIDDLIPQNDYTPDATPSVPQDTSNANLTFSNCTNTTTSELYENCTTVSDNTTDELPVDVDSDANAERFGIDESTIGTISGPVTTTNYINMAESETDPTTDIQEIIQPGDEITRYQSIFPNNFVNDVYNAIGNSYGTIRADFDIDDGVDFSELNLRDHLLTDLVIPEEDYDFVRDDIEEENNHQSTLSPVTKLECQCGGNITSNFQSFILVSFYNDKQINCQCTPPKEESTIETCVNLLLTNKYLTKQIKSYMMNDLPYFLNYLYQINRSESSATSLQQKDEGKFSNKQHKKFHSSPKLPREKLAADYYDDKHEWNKTAVSALEALGTGTYNKFYKNYLRGTAKTAYPPKRNFRDDLLRNYNDLDILNDIAYHSQESDEFLPNEQRLTAPSWTESYFGSHDLTYASSTQSKTVSRPKKATEKHSKIVKKTIHRKPKQRSTHHSKARKPRPTVDEKTDEFPAQFEEYTDILAKKLPNGDQKLGEFLYINPQYAPIDNDSYGPLPNFAEQKEVTYDQQIRLPFDAQMHPQSNVLTETFYSNQPLENYPTYQSNQPDIPNTIIQYTNPFDIPVIVAPQPNAMMVHTPIEGNYRLLHLPHVPRMLDNSAPIGQRASWQQFMFNPNIKRSQFFDNAEITTPNYGTHSGLIGGDANVNTKKK